VTARRVGIAAVSTVVLNLCACRPAPSTITSQLPEGFGASLAPRELPTINAEELRQSRAVRRCDRGTCVLDASFDDARAPAKMSPWVIEPGSTVRVEPGDYDVLAMVVAGSVVASPARAASREADFEFDQDQRSEAWTAIRSAGIGLSLYVDGSSPPAAVVLVIARDEPQSAETPSAPQQTPREASAGDRAKLQRPPSPRLELRPLAALPWLSWGGGSFRAKIAFEGASAPRASLGVLVGAARASVAEHVHDGSYELLTAIVSDGMVQVAGGAEGQLGHQAIVRPGDPQVIPAGVRHSWQPAGTLPLVAVQAYAPGGPEQRFRALSGGR
jgi:mannose-6-phosphate isomerase-like protein (cupin superfamily)